MLSHASNRSSSGTHVSLTHSSRPSLRRQSLVSFCGAMACLFLAAPSALATTFTWTGSVGDNNWFTPGNWSPSGVPGASDTATIPSGTPAANAPVEVAVLTLTTGTLSGSGQISVSQTLNWNGGTISGTGELVLLPGATWGITTGIVTLSRPMRNEGAITWSGGGNVTISNATLTNDNLIQWTAPSGSPLLLAGSGSPQLINNGSIIKTGAATARIATLLTNSGSISINQGRLDVNGTLTNTAAADITTTASGHLAIATNATYAPDSTLSNGGTLTFTSGTHTFPAGSFSTSGLTFFTGGTVTLNDPLSVADLRVSGALIVNGTLSATTGTCTGTITAAGDFSIASSLAWNGGTIGGSGNLIIEPAATCTISSSNVTLACPMRCDGTLAWIGSGNLICNDATITINGALNVSAASSPNLSAGTGTNLLINNGTFTKTGTSTSGLGIPFTNNGTITINNGTVSTTALFTNRQGGSVTVNDPGRFTFNTTSSIIAGSSMGGNGLITFSGGTHTFPSGTFSSSGNVNFAAGTVTLNDSINYPNLTVAGTLNVNDTITAATGSLSGTLNATGDISFSDALTLNTCTISGSGLLKILPSANCTVTTGNVTLSRSLLNQGILTWSGTGNIISNNVTITNSGTINITATSGSPNLYQGTGTSSFVNNGTYSKTGASAATIAVAVTNNGSLSVSQGSLDITREFSNGSSGTVTVTNPGRLELSASSTYATGSSIQGNGTFVISGGTHTFLPTTFSLGGPVTLSSGTISIDDPLTASTLSIGANLSVLGPVTATNLTVTGTLNARDDIVVSGAFSASAATIGRTAGGTGSLILLPGSIWNLSSSSDSTFRCPIINNGTINWSGSADINLDGTAFTNNAVINVSAASSTLIIDAVGAAPSAFTNNGIIRKSGTSTLSLNTPSTNNGSLLITGGICQTAASFTNALEGIVDVGPGTLTFSSPITNYNHTDKSLSLGTWSLRSTGRITITSPVGASIQQIKPDTTLAIDGPAATFFNSTNTNALSSLGLVDGSLDLNSLTFTTTPAGGTFVNTGTLTLNPAANLIITGDALLAPAATLAVRCSAPSTFGHITVSGNATIDGTLQAEPVGSFEPSESAGFEAVSAAALDGQFALALGGNGYAPTPYYTTTGAYYNFIQCPVFTSSPESTTTCPDGPATFAVAVAGTSPINLKWEILPPGSSGPWIPIDDGTIELLGTFTGTDTQSLEITQLDRAATGTLLRVLVTNDCGSFASNAASLTVCACFACPADFNQDGGVDGSDIDAFFTAWEAGSCDADTNFDGGIDGSDIDPFFTTWEAGGC